MKRIFLLLLFFQAIAVMAFASLEPKSPEEEEYEAEIQLAIKTYEKYIPKCRNVEDNIETLYYTAALYWNIDTGNPDSYYTQKARQYFEEIASLCKQHYGEHSLQYVVALSLLDWTYMLIYSYTPHDERIGRLLSMLYKEKNRQLWCLKILANLWSIQLHEGAYINRNIWYLNDKESGRWRPLKYGFFNLCKAIDRSYYSASSVCNRAIPLKEYSFDYYYNMALSAYDVRYCTLLADCDHLFTSYDIVDIACTHINQLYSNASEGLYETVRPLLAAEVSSRTFRNRTVEDICAGYDAVLLRKGLALQNEHRALLFSEHVDENKAFQLSSDYINEREYLHFFRLHTTDADSIQQIKKQIQELSSKYKEDWDALGRQIDERYVDFMSVNWQSIRQSLHNDDIAIEFVRLPEDEGALYYALTLRKDYDCPHLVPLCRESDFEDRTDDDIFHDDIVYKFVWQPLQEEISNARNIFFSADGLFHKLPLEYISDCSHTQFAEALKERKLYRLSSTRELFLERKTMSPERSAIYGGMQFSADSIITINTSRGAITTSFGYLNGSLDEAVAIDSVCRCVGMATSLYTDYQGSETSFKKLSGQENDIIHIATHGFYIDAPTAKNGEPLLGDKFYSNLDYKGNIIDDPMLRSGLLFSNADMMFNEESLPEEANDGVLYSKEVGELNLSNTGLVVLSACQTGLGEITSDGAFGLQRGFKKAGVNSILMSLWKVDDEATCKLMTEFYSNWIGKKMKKHDALEAAKKAVRETKGWEDPKYWAAFILLDGLD